MPAPRRFGKEEVMRPTDSMRVRAHGESPWTRPQDAHTYDRLPVPVAPDLVWRAVVTGDRLAWNQLTDQYAPMLWSVARSIGLTETDASQVIQRTWVSLLDNSHRLPDAADLPMWLAQTARREAMAVGRSAAPVATDISDRERDAEQLLDEPDTQLWDGFRQLSAECQGLLRAVTAPDRPGYAEVGAALGLPVDSIESSCHDCLQRLRQLLDGSLERRNGEVVGAE
jgi:DNA-directed RNA polymerase specialized sigma24 family protein